MGSLALVLACLAVPAGHQVVSHRVILKSLRAVFWRNGPEVSPTPHELRHRDRPRRLRLLADAAWLSYLAGVLVLALILPR
jgi:hypothetical protein